MTQNMYRGIKKVSDPVIFQREVESVVNQILQGKLNATGYFTVLNGTTTTTVTDFRVTVDCYIGFTALDATSADTTTFYISDRDQTAHTFEITHNNIVTDREYVYVIIG